VVTFDTPVVLPRFLSAARFEVLQREVGRLTKTERSYVPLHKKGAAIAYSVIRRSAPAIVEFYRSPDQCRTISDIAQLAIEPTPPRDESSLSVLVYDQPGDHIGWHYDHNFYRGRHFTVLLTIENRGHQAGGLSASCLLAKCHGEEQAISTPANTLVVFEGARVLHKVVPIHADERRVVLSMTYCRDPRISLPREVARRFKDMAFFGPRALWA
jgi:hypothetical protein